jgi:hypothetical protein
MGASLIRLNAMNRGIRRLGIPLARFSPAILAAG